MRAKLRELSSAAAAALYSVRVDVRIHARRLAYTVQLVRYTLKIYLTDLRSLYFTQYSALFSILRERCYRCLKPKKELRRDTQLGPAGRPAL